MNLYRSFLLLREEHLIACLAFIRSNWKVLADSGKPLVVTIEEKGGKRTSDQNKRYRAILREISEQVWIDGKQFSDEVLHEYFKRKFIGTSEGPGGETYGISTTTLTVDEFCNYSNRVELHAAEEWGWIPT